jgi:hypothetical protein
VFRSDLSLWLPKTANFDVRYFNENGKAVRDSNVAGTRRLAVTDLLLESAAAPAATPPCRKVNEIAILAYISKPSVGVLIPPGLPSFQTLTDTPGFGVADKRESTTF